MKRRAWKSALLLLVPLALYAYIAECNSWRPKTIALPSFVIPRHLRFSPDGRLLAFVDVGMGDKTDVLICDVATERMVARIESAEGPLFLGQSEKIAVSCPSEKTSDSEWRTKIYSVPNVKLITVGPRFYTHDRVLSDGKTLIGWMQNKQYGKLFRWDSNSNKPPTQCFALPALPPQETARRFWLLADNTSVIDEYNETKNASHRTLHCWDVFTQKLVFKVRERGGNLISFGSSSNGLFAFFNGDKLEVWNCKTGQLQSSFAATQLLRANEKVSSLSIDNLEFSPDGSLIAASINNNYVGVWDTNTGKSIRYLTVKHKHIGSLAFSPDGRILATGGDDGTVKLWRIK